MSKMDYTKNGYLTNRDGTVNFKIKGYPVWWTVKAEFLDKVEDPKQMDHIVLIEEHDVTKYWHCTVGPAVWADTPEVRKHFNGDLYEEFWMDGKRMSDVDATAEKHRLQFDGKFDELVDELSVDGK